MLFLKLCILLVLGVIFIQDFKSRSVYWFSFPVLSLLFLITRLEQHQLLSEIRQQVLVNTGFLLLQLFIISVYFSIKNKRLVNITGSLLGWGDILFLLSIAFFLSILNFLFFYIGSLILILLGWLAWQRFSKEKNEQIPLAGLQAIMLLCLLAIDWWWLPINITNDDWIIRLITK